MNGLSYRQKFALIILLFALPLSYLVYQLSSEINISRTLAQKERKGLAYIIPLRHLFELTQQHRGMLNATLSGDSSFNNRLSENENRIHKEIDVVDFIDKKGNASLSTTERWNALRVRWRGIESHERNLAPQESFRVHTLWIAELLDLIAHVGDTSTLILDPDLDTYYLMDTVVNKLPLMIEKTGQLRGLGAGYSARQKMTAEERVRFAILSSELQTTIEQTLRGLRVASEANASLQSRLGTLVRKSVDINQIFLSTSKSKILNASRITIRPTAYFIVGTQALDTDFQLFDTASERLDVLLQARSERSLRKLWGVSLFVTGILILVLYLYAGITGQLQKEWRQAQEESARARRAETSLRTQYAVSLVLATSATLEDAAPKILQAVCDTSGWDLCQLWLVGSRRGGGFLGPAFLRAGRALSPLF